MSWWRPLVDLALFAIAAGLFLGSIRVFLAFRWRRAEAAGGSSTYVPHADPLLPPVVALAGGAVFVLLRLIA